MQKKLTAKSTCDALRDLVPFVQFKKREKHPWRSVNFNKVAGLTSTPPELIRKPGFLMSSEGVEVKPSTLLKLTFLHGCFSRF